MDEEIEMLKKQMKVERTEIIGNRQFYVGTCAGRDVVLVRSQVGKVNAAMTAQILIRDFKVDQIIFTGVAGGVDSALQPGDIVVSTTLSQHDYGVLNENDLIPRPIKTPQADGSTKMITEFPADAQLLELAYQAGMKADLKQIKSLPTGYEKRKPKVVKGVIVSGDQFISSEKKRDWLRTKFNASAVEMEGAAVAQVCLTFNVRCVVIRCISDRADAASRNVYILMKNEAADNSALLVTTLLKEDDLNAPIEPK